MLYRSSDGQTSPQLDSEVGAEAVTEPEDAAVSVHLLFGWPSRLLVIVVLKPLAFTEILDHGAGVRSL
jgi:hypothetical protein